MFGTVQKQGKEIIVPITKDFSITLDSTHFEDNIVSIPRKSRSFILEIEQEILDACSEHSSTWFGKEISVADLDELFISNIKKINIELPEDYIHHTLVSSKNFSISVHNITLGNELIQLNWKISSIQF